MPRNSGWSDGNTPFAFGESMTGIDHSSASAMRRVLVTSSFASIPARMIGRLLWRSRFAAAPAGPGSIAGIASGAMRRVRYWTV